MGQLNIANHTTSTRKVHHWTKQETEMLVSEYDGTCRKAELIACKVNHETGDRISMDAVMVKAFYLGLCKPKSFKWSPDDDEKLKSLFTRYPLKIVAEKMNRAPGSVKVRARQLRCSSKMRDDWYCKQDIVDICGVARGTVLGWIKSGTLKASLHHGNGTVSNDTWHIDESDFRDFLLEHIMELQGRNVDLFTLVHILVKDKELR